MNNIDGEIKRAREEQARYEQLKRRLATLHSQREELAAREAVLRAARAEEQEDVDNLEGRSLMRFIYSLTGGLEDKLDQERAGARAAAVKHDAAVRELEDLDEDIEEAGQELKRLEGCEERYDGAIRRKAEMLKAAGSPASGRLAALEKDMSQTAYSLRETGEALGAARAAARRAEAVVDALQGAADLGTLDLLTDSMFVNLAKRERIDQAQYAIEDLRVSLRRLNTELADIGTAGLDLDIGDFLGFADFFFDGIFVDLAVNSRINASLSSAEGVLSQLSSLENRLASTEDGLRARAAELEREYGDAVANA